MARASDAVIGRLAAFDELLVTLAMVVSAFVGAAAVTRFGIVAGPLVGVVLSIGGLTVARMLEKRTPLRADESTADRATQHAA